MRVARFFAAEVDRLAVAEPADIAALPQESQLAKPRVVVAMHHRALRERRQIHDDEPLVLVIRGRDAEQRVFAVEPDRDRVGGARPRRDPGE